MRNRFNDEEDFNPNVTVRHVFGVGLDNHDGHKRVTTGEQFSVLGGSEETHERLTETFVKTFEDLRRQGKRLEQTHPEELAEIIYKHSC